MVSARWSTVRATKEFLRRQFPGCLISLYENVEWPPYTPDLTPPDFFLWGYLKDRIYANPKPSDLEQLQANIQREIQNIPRETFPSVMNNVAVRMQAVVGKLGAYIDRVFFLKKILNIKKEKTTLKTMHWVDNLYLLA